MAQLTPTKIFQTNFTPEKGNSLQACIASIFHCSSIDEVPNFIEDPSGYHLAIQKWLDQSGKHIFLKIPRTEGGLEFPVHTPMTCLVTGKSPRGNFNHVVVGQFLPGEKQPTVLHDPHPDGTGLDDTKGWIGLFVGQMTYM